MLDRIRRSLAKKLILASAVPSATVLLVGLLLLINHSQRLALTDPAAAFAELRGGAIAGTAVALLFAGVAVGLATRRFLVHPIALLSKVMARAEGGDFLVRAKVATDDELGRLSRSFNTMLARVTDMAVHEIETARSLEQMEREVTLRRELEQMNERLASHLREMELLLDVSSALSGTLDLPEQLQQLGENVRARLVVDQVTLLLFDEMTDDLVVEAVCGKSPSSTRGTRFQLGEGITGQVAAQGQTIYVPDVEADARFLQTKGTGHVHGSFIGVPLKAKGRLVGVMALYRPKKGEFSAQDIRLAEAIATQAGLAISNARLYAQTLEFALTDPLTGLPNRRALFSRLEQEATRAARYGDALTVLMIDLDHFKSVNDTHGHLVGDVVLRGVALVLNKSVRKADSVARYGGEEFCVVLPRLAKAEALEVAEKLRRAVAQTPIAAKPGEPPLHVTLSVGIASYPQDATDVIALLERADEALYEAKRGGRDRVSAVARAVG